MIARLAQTLTTPEILHLVTRLMPQRVLSVAFVLDWSRWRRQHQLRAAIVHRRTRQYMQL